MYYTTSAKTDLYKKNISESKILLTPTCILTVTLHLQILPGTPAFLTWATLNLFLRGFLACLFCFCSF